MDVTKERKTMNIPKQEYTAEFKELAVKRVKDGQSIGAAAKELGLVEQTLRNWVTLIILPEFGQSGRLVPSQLGALCDYEQPFNNIRAEPWCSNAVRSTQHFQRLGLC
jgi:hypothetical protein